jgi:hypothetical protein
MPASYKIPPTSEIPSPPVQPAVPVADDSLTAPAAGDPLEAGERATQNPGPALISGLQRVIRDRPLTALAVAAGVGSLLGIKIKR